MVTVHRGSRRWRVRGSRGPTRWSQWCLSTSSCSPERHRNHGRPMISDVSVSGHCYLEQRLLTAGLPPTSEEWWGSFLLPALTTCPNGGLPFGYCISVSSLRPAWPKTCGAARLKISCGAFCSRSNNLSLWGFNKKNCSPGWQFSDVDFQKGKGAREGGRAVCVADSSL